VGLNFNIEILNMDRYERFAFRLNDHDILVEVCVKIDEPEPAQQADATPAQEAGSRQPLDDATIQKMITQANRDAGAETPPAVPTDGNDSLLAAANSDKGSEVKPDDAASAEVKDSASTDGATNLAKAKETASPAPMSMNVEPEEVDSGMPGNVSFIRDIPVHIVVELGRTKMSIKNILGLGKGSAIALSNLEGETLDIRANNRLIAKGEVLVENDKYGIRIREIVGAVERVGRLVG
jgi:flagellar motor switch protein FliN/FliY